MMNPEEFEKKMEEIEKKDPGDWERIHSKQDALMCDLLSSLGYENGIEVFKRTTKWCA